jgi:F0F1-type ATP synthase assembly protein I
VRTAPQFEDRAHVTQSDPGEDPRRGRNRKLVVYLRYSAAGTQLFAAIGLGTLLGWWLDKKTGLSPICLVLCMFLGFGSGFYALYRELFGRKR